MSQEEAQNEHIRGFSARQLPILVLLGMLVLALVMMMAPSPPSHEIKKEGSYEAGEDIADGTWSFRIPQDGSSKVALHKSSTDSSDELDAGDDEYILVTLSEGDIVEVEGQAVGAQSKN